jgi:hypothetical protein
MRRTRAVIGLSAVGVGVVALIIALVAARRCQPAARV